MPGHLQMLGWTLSGGVLLAVSFVPALAGPSGAALTDAKAQAAQSPVVKVNGYLRSPRRPVVGHVRPHYQARRIHGATYYGAPRAHYRPAYRHAAPPAYYGSPAYGYAPRAYGYARPAYYAPPAYGYARPAYVAPKYAAHPMPGWDRAKWADPNHQTPKYVIGRILSGFKPRTENMDRVVAEIAKAYPGTRRTGSGDITIPGIGSTDILQAADVGGKGWRFGGTSGGQQQALTPGAQQVQNTAMDPYTQLLQSLIQPQQGQQMPQQPAAAQEPSAEMMAMQQQMQSMWQELQAAKQQQQRTSPQFSYF